MTYKNIICPTCHHIFNISADNMRSKRTDSMPAGLFREHFNLQCPKCNCQVLFTMEYEIRYATAKSPRADGTIVYSVYPDMDGSIDPKLWQEQPKEVY